MADGIWQRPLYDIPALFLRKIGDRIMATTCGAHITGLPLDKHERTTMIENAWIRLLFQYPVLRVYLSHTEGGDVLEYASSATDIEEYARSTVLVHDTWEGEPADWLAQMKFPAEPQSRGQLHVFNEPKGVWIL